MTDERTLKGFWWNPSCPDHRWFGILSRTENVIELVCYSNGGAPRLVSDSFSSTVCAPLDGLRAPTTMKPTPVDH